MALITTLKGLAFFLAIIALLIVIFICGEMGVLIFLELLDEKKRRKKRARLWEDD